MARTGWKRLVAAVVVAAAGVSCGDVVRQGRSPVFLVIDQLTGSAGSTTPGPFTNPLASDVRLESAPCSAMSPCIFNDLGQVALRIVPKDIGTATAPSSLSSNNAVTITRYRVAYRRTDGRDTQGVDVPYAFDGAVTGTVQPGPSRTLSFELVRHVAKQEPPLVQLGNNPAIITTIAEVTFFGQDLVGNDISATGLIQINFGNLADPE